MHSVFKYDINIVFLFIPRFKLDGLLKDFKTFRSTGTHGLEWPSLTRCAVIIRDGDNTIESVNIFENNNGIDAEKDAITYLMSLPKVKEDGRIELYINWSPCDECSQQLLNFSKEKNAELTIIFASLYYIERPSCIEKEHTHENAERKNYRDGLKQLNEDPQITIRTFENNDWVELFRILLKYYFDGNKRVIHEEN